MPHATLTDLLERNARHTESLPEGYFDDVQSGQQPAVVSVCCSDSRVSQEGMWDVSEPGWLFTAGNIGNQTWDVVDGERVVDGSVCYPVTYTDTKLLAVVGHTGCGAITAALQAVRGKELDAPPGIADRVRSLIPVVEEALTEEVAAGDDLIDQLVEYNVDRQVEFLLDSEEISDEESVFGFVYDFQGVYGDVRGRCYLVNDGGVTDTETLRDRVPDGHESSVQRLLE